ncbi:MAG: CinA family protein [Gammaproteobacteria bacterium]
MAKQVPTRLDKHLKQILVQKKLRYAVAESCTGGLVAARLTAYPGSSQWFDCGLVTYSNEAKQQFLGVPKETLEQFGAVSRETAIAMAEGILQRTQVDLSLSITGIAGPSGGSKEKPVGTVWFAWASKTQPTRTEVHHLVGTRTYIRKTSVIIALNGLLQSLEIKE